MNRIKVFAKNFQDSMATIDQFRSEPSSMQALVEWMLNTDANPFAYLPHDWAGALESADAFAGLLHCIHHALYDDGDIAFVTVDGEPRIVLADKHDSNFRDRVLSAQEKELEKRKVFGEVRPREVCVLDIESCEFGPLYDAWQVADLKRCFASDAGRHSVEFAVEHYRKYACFNESWIEECAKEIQKWAQFYRPAK